MQLLLIVGVSLSRLTPRIGLVNWYLVNNLQGKSVINRSAIILRYKKPAVDWINDADPVIENPGITLESVNTDRNVYLISDDDGDNEKSVALWVKDNCQVLFENEIHAWYLDESLWPKLSGLKMFNEWFDVEHHSIVLDTLDEPIEDDEF